MLFVILAAIIQKKYWLDFLIAEFEKITSYPVQKAVSEKSYDILLQALKILVDPDNLTHTTTFVLSEASLYEGVPNNLKSGHILPGAGCQVQHNNILEAKKEIVYMH